MKRSTTEWIEKAEGDFRSAAKLLASAPPEPDQVCFLSQQCAEKYLKAVLNEQGQDFPRTHDLRVLSDLVRPSVSHLDAMTDRLEYLSQWAFLARYPGRSAREREAEQARDIAGEVRRLCREVLGLVDA